MLQFNRRQMAAIGEDSMRIRLRDHLRQHLPQLENVPAQELDQEITPLLADARRHGLNSQRAAAVFVLANVVLGRKTVAGDPTVQEILSSRARPVADRARLLEIWLTRSWGGLQRRKQP